MSKQWSAHHLKDKREAAEEMLAALEEHAKHEDDYAEGRIDGNEFDRLWGLNEQRIRAAIAAAKAAGITAES